MLKIETTRFGTVSVKEESVFEMPFGMPGFHSQRNFVVIQHNEKSPFFWYQSVEDPSLAFVITNPYLFVPDYSVNVDDVFAKMSWDPCRDKEHLVVYAIVNIPRGAPDKITANLVAPLLLNNRAQQALQMIVSDSPYSHKFSLSQQNSSSQ